MIVSQDPYVVLAYNMQVWYAEREAEARFKVEAARMATRLSQVFGTPLTAESELVVDAVVEARSIPYRAE